MFLIDIECQIGKKLGSIGRKTK